MNKFCIALFFIRNELTALYTFIQHLSDDDDVHLYSAVTPCCYTYNMLGRVVSFEACCQWCANH